MRSFPWAKQWLGLVLRQPWLLLLAMGVIAPATFAADDQRTGMVVHAIPWADGHEVWVWADVANGLGTPVSGILCDSVSGGCQTMTCAALSCGGTLTGLPARTTIVGQITIAITLSSAQTLESGPLPFTRAFVPASDVTEVTSPDNMLVLTFFPDSLPADTYVLILATTTPPGAPPAAHRLVGQPYNLRASGALVVSEQAMALHLAYDALWLDGISPHNLSILAWNPLDETWEEMGGTLFADQDHLSAPVQRFTTYALMEIPAWRDTFADASGLSLANGTSPTAEGALVLSDGALSGVAVSTPVTPTAASASWDQVLYTHTTSPTTNLTVDVLSLDGRRVLTDVASGASLTGLDAAQYPALKLRTTLSSTAAGETPVLDQWRLTWQVEAHQVYLPVVLR